MASTKPFSVVELPKDYSNSTELQTAVDRFKEIRLSALKNEPEFFGSTYEVESQFPFEVWAGRLTNPLARTFIGIRENFPQDAETQVAIRNNEWLGTLVLLGPKDTFESITAAASPWKTLNSVRDSEITDEHKGGPVQSGYQIAGMYVRPEARGLRLGRRLVLAALDRAREEMRGSHVSDAKIFLLTDDDNEASRALYKSCGFEITGKEEYIGHRGQTKLALRLELLLQA